MVLEANQTKKLQITIGFERSSSITWTIKEYTQTAKEMEMLKTEMTWDITKHILKSEQACRKMFLEGQLQMAILFVEILKPRNPFKPSSSMGDNIW